MVEMQMRDPGSPRMQLIGAPSCWAWVECGSENCAKSGSGAW